LGRNKSIIGKSLMTFKYFKMREFYCPMTKREEMDMRFVKTLDGARAIAGIPFRITSGYRSKEYQEDLRKRGYPTSRGKSPHEKGVACDIYVKNDMARATILSALQEVGFNRFGIASNFIHVDSDFDRNANRIWHYKI
jgi:uncharacterized protein YcbK (DUF882 family)